MRHFSGIGCRFEPLWGRVFFLCVEFAWIGVNSVVCWAPPRLSRQQATSHRQTKHPVTSVTTLTLCMCVCVSVWARQKRYARSRCLTQCWSFKTELLRQDISMPRFVMQKIMWLPKLSFITSHAYRRRVTLNLNPGWDCQSLSDYKGTQSWPLEKRTPFVIAIDLHTTRDRKV